MKKVIRKVISYLLIFTMLIGMVESLGSYVDPIGTDEAEAASKVKLNMKYTAVSSGDHLASVTGEGYTGMCAKAYYKGYLGNHTYTMYNSSKYCKDNIMEKLAYYYGYQRGWTSGVNGSKLSRCFNYVSTQSDSSITGTAYFYSKSTFESMIKKAKNVDVPDSFVCKFAIPTGNTRWQSVVIWKMNPSVKISKSSSDSVTNKLSSYSLEGIKFGIYTKKNTSSSYKKGTLTVKANGKTNTVSLPADTYYIHEDYIPSGSNYKALGWKTVELKSVKNGATASERTKTVPLKDTPVKGSLTFTKKLEKGGDASGFKFTLTHKENSKLTYTATSDSNGKVTFSNLYLGNYTLTETATLKPDGLYYPQDGMPDKVKITSGKNKINDSNTYVNKTDTLGGIIIQKVLIGEGDLKGWKFKVTKDGENYYEGATDSAGMISLEECPAGTYTITEVLTDAQKATYKTSYSTQTVTITDNDATSKFVEVTNTERRGEVKIQKTSSIGEISDIGFKIKGTTAAGAAYEEDFITDEEGVITTDIPAGNYKVIETGFDSTHYKFNEKYEQVEIDGEIYPARSIKVTGDETSAITVDFENIPYKITLEKTAVDFKGNNTGNPVIGAVYELHEIDSGDPIFLESQTTDENGRLTFDTRIEYGKQYKIYETVYPNGFVEEEAEEDEPGVLKKTITVDGTEGEYLIKDTNQLTYGLIMGMKYDADDPLQPVEGATYTLYTDPECTKVATDIDGNECKGKTDKYGTIKFDNLDWNVRGTTYYLKEIKAPKGYELSEEVREYTLGYNEETGEYDVFIFDNELLNIREKGSIELTKTNEAGDKRLNNAVYSLYKADGTLVKGKLVTGADNDGDGSSDGTGKIMLNALEWGKYYLVEDEAPDGYAVSDEKKTFAVNAYSAGSTQKLTVTDKVQTTIVTATKKIKAEDIHFDHGTPTFTFKLTGTTVGGKNVTKYKMVTFSESYVQNHTDADGYVSMSATFSDLEAGDYTLTEESVSRYTLEHIEANPMNGTISGGSVIFKGLDQNKNGAATFVNKKYEWEDDSDATAAVNNLKRDAKLTSLFADCKEMTYEGNAIINWSDILEVYAIYDVGTEKELQESEYEIVDVDGNVVKSGSHLPREAGSYVYTVKYEEGGVLATATVSLDISAAKLYTVKFDTHSGSGLSDVKVYKYDSIKEATQGVEALYTTTRTGYKFNGWYDSYKDGAYGNQFKVTDQVLGDMTLHAHWIENSYKIEFDGNGATGGSQVTMTRSYTKSATLPTTTNYVKTGYSFEGWYTSASGGNAITEVAANTARNVKVYAHWKETNAPQAGISVTNNLSETQTATLTGTASSGISSYYFGTNSSPGDADYAAANGDTTFTKDVGITSAGTYYFFVKSKAGQVSTPASVTIYQTVFMDGTGTTIIDGDGTRSIKYVLTEDKQSITLPEVYSSSGGPEFIGWTTTTDASVSDNGKWYDAGSEYEVTKNSNLYYRTYDVDTLEKAISGSVRSGDIKLGPSMNVGDITLSPTGFANVTLDYVTVDSGYQEIGPGALPYWKTGNVAVNPFGVNTDRFAVRRRNSSATNDITINPTVKTLQVYKRTGTVSTGDIDSRICNMQNIADACLSYKVADGDLKTISKGETAQLAGTESVTTTAVTAESGYRNICVAGWGITRNSGGKLVTMLQCATYTTQIRIHNNSLSEDINVTANVRVLQERVKNVGTRSTPTYGAYDTKAQKRLAALNALASSEKKFFKYSNCSTTVDRSTRNITLTSTNIDSKTISISGHDRVVCPVGFYFWNDGDGSTGCSYTSIKSFYYQSYANDSSANLYISYGGSYQGSGYKYPNKCTVSTYSFVINK